MKRFVIIAASLCLLAAVYCLPHVKPFVNTLIVIVAGRLGLPIYQLAGRLGVPLDDASARVPRVGQYKEYIIDEPVYDVLMYYFDGAKGKQRLDVASAGMKAIRKGGFTYNKKMTLIIFCNLTTPDKSHKAAYPFGLFVESERIKSPVSIKELATNNFIESPMNWDSRINEWIYTTNNLSSTGPDISENAEYASSNRVLDGSWFLYLLKDSLTNKAQVYATFGMPKYYVRERGVYSEVYPVDDATRSQAGTVRVWYEADRVARTGCYMENK